MGTPLVKALMKEVGPRNVIATDISKKKVNFECDYHELDVTDFNSYKQIVKEEQVDYIIHLAAILSALGEKVPDTAINVNVQGSLNAMNIAKEFNCQLFIPSTIAVFGGDNFDKKNTPLHCALEPTTVYGVTKVYNELLGTYYFNKYGILNTLSSTLPIGVDFRSIRYPGIISSEKYDFNGTTDYSTGKKLLCSSRIVFLISYL